MTTKESKVTPVQAIKAPMKLKLSQVQVEAMTQSEVIGVMTGITGYQNPASELLKWASARLGSIAREQANVEQSVALQSAKPLIMEVLKPFFVKLTMVTVPPNSPAQLRFDLPDRQKMADEVWKCIKESGSTWRGTLNIDLLTHEITVGDKKKQPVECESHTKPENDYPCYDGIVYASYEILCQRLMLDLDGLSAQERFNRAYNHAEIEQALWHGVNPLSKLPSGFGKEVYLGGYPQ